jgi:hypothetical protein
MARPGLAIFTHGRFTGVATPASKGLSIFTWGKFGAQSLAAALDGDLVRFDLKLSEKAQVSLVVSQSRAVVLGLSQSRLVVIEASLVKQTTFSVVRVNGVVLEKSGLFGVELER